ncbi:MAG: PAS domain-containing sensor histidine kinase [Ginsengibacter sp.]
MKNIKRFLEETDKLIRENKQIQKLRNGKEYIESIKTGGIDGLVINDDNALKVYTEKTADKAYRILIEKMNEAAVTLNEDGTILYCNLSFANLVKLPLQKVVGTLFTDFINKSIRDRFEDFLKQGRENTLKEEVHLYSDDGLSVPVMMSVNHFSTDNAFILSIILTDLTIYNKNRDELKNRAQELEEKNEDLRTANNKILALNTNLEKRVYERTMQLENLNHELKDLNVSKDKFLSVISHDLRNPLTALLIASDALSMDTENPVFDGVQPFIKVINSTSHNILNQLNELVDWAQKQREKTDLKPEKIQLVFNADLSLELLKPNAEQKNITLKNEVGFDIFVHVDFLMLRSILQNLVTNSIKYTPAGGSITVTARSVNKMTEISVTDTGTGMEEVTRKHLFTNTRYESLPGTNNEKGTGLGLILVKDFVTQHGGTIKAVSQIGKGTSIIFTLPG